MSELFLGNNHKNEPVHAQYNMLNRHGLIAGATGTGKTVTLQVLVEQLSKQGVPTFLADVKGDLSSLSQEGKMNDIIAERVEKLGLSDFSFRNFPVELWDVFGENGTNIRTTISEMGPILLARIMDLSPAQDALLHTCFRISDENAWHLIDTKDLRSLLVHISNNRKEFASKYGNISPASIGGIQRSLLILEGAGGDVFFGEPDLDIMDLFSHDQNGNGISHILDARKLMNDGRLYSTFLLWLLSELFETLPEVGDVDTPKMVFFFDEAHLLFNDAPKILIEKVEQVVRLIRSKGVGIFFITQNPIDIPDTIRSQLGNRIQHALRAYTPKDKKAIKDAADTFRTNDDFETADRITDMSIGYALVSMLDEKGRPSTVQHTMIRPPESQIGAIDERARNSLMNNARYSNKYATAVDRESAHEQIGKILEKETPKSSGGGLGVFLKEQLFGRTTGRKKQGMVEQIIKTEIRRIGRNMIRDAGRGILGVLTK